MKHLNKKGVISVYTYIMLLGVSIVIGGILSGTVLMNHFTNEILGKTKSFYAAETGVEEGLLAFKKNPDLEAFIPNEDIIEEERNRRVVEYTEQKVYKKELIIEELIPAGKSIQLPFIKRELDSRITKFHIAIMKYDTKSIPDGQMFCETPEFDSSVEIAAYQKARIYTTEPLDYDVELNSNWNGCYIGNNVVGKTSLITYTDPFSNERVNLIGDKCIINAKSNVTGTVFERIIPQMFLDGGDPMELTTNRCQLNCGTCSEFYNFDPEVRRPIGRYLRFYTIAPNFEWTDMTNDGLIMFNIRAIDNDAHVAIWATDNNGIAYEIPGRYINFSSLGITQGGDLNEGLFTRLRLKRKFDDDLLPIFDYSLYSESELVK